MGPSLRAIGADYQRTEEFIRPVEKEVLTLHGLRRVRGDAGAGSRASMAVTISAGQTLFLLLTLRVTPAPSSAATTGADGGRLHNR